MHRESCVKDYSIPAAPRILKFGTNIGYDYLHCVRRIQHPLFVHFSFSRIKYFITDFSATTSLMILKFGIGYDKLYCLKENKHPYACHSPYLFIFLSF